MAAAGFHHPVVKPCEQRPENNVGDDEGGGTYQVRLGPCAHDLAEYIKRDLVTLAARLIDRYGDQAPPKEDLSQLANLIWRLRPLAMVAVESEVQRAMEDAANKFLIERISNVFGHSDLSVPPATEPKPSEGGQ